MDVDKVVLTDTAKSKCFRMLSQDRLKQEVNDRVWRKKSDENIYFIETSFKNRKGQNEKVRVLIQKKEEDGEDVAIVITQKHKYHAN